MAIHQMPMTKTAIASHCATLVGCGNAAARPAAPRPAQPLTNRTSVLASSHGRSVTPIILTFGLGPFLLKRASAPESVRS